MGSIVIFRISSCPPLFVVYQYHTCNWFYFSYFLLYENGNIVKDKKDTWDIYAIFYETDEKTKTLDATNRFDHPNLISIARIDEKDRKETDEWTEFYLPFVTKTGKTVDKDKLKAGKYNVAIVFSSSIEGDYFRGAVGSTLHIDEVELIHAAD